MYYQKVKAADNRVKACLLSTVSFGVTLKKKKKILYSCEENELFKRTIIANVLDAVYWLIRKWLRTFYSG